MIEILTSQNSNTLPKIIAFLIAIVFCMSIHEYAHAKIAFANGDDTAYLSGRMTLNPFAHIDLIGLLMLLLLGFGWAKPVPIDPNRFSDKKCGMLRTASAGIVANLFFSFFGAGLYVLFGNLASLVSEDNFANFILTFLQLLFWYFTIINLNLAIFNLIPVPPLDGYNILKSATKYDNKFVVFAEKNSKVLSIALILICSIFPIVESLSSFAFVPFVEFWKFVWVL